MHCLPLDCTKELQMIWKIMALLIIALLLDAGYILLIIASKAKERADKVTKMLKEKQEYENNRRR